jgi:aerobic carbon-monoxide dehydrogenase medium subunit
VKFEVFEPRSIEEAVSLLSANEEEARIIAGGQSLLLMVRSGLVRPRSLISLNALTDLTGIKVTPENNLFVGALATHRQILASPYITERANILSRAASRIGSTPVRNFGTIGGNLCHNEMGSDPPTALLALNTTAECVSPRGKRKMPLAQLFTDYFETSLRPDEILTGVEIPVQAPTAKGVYLKHTNRPGDLAIVGVAAMIAIQEGICAEVRLALGGVGPVPFRATQAEDLLRARTFDDRIVDKAASAAAEMSDPMSDAHASADYRRKMVKVFVKRALDLAAKNV